MNLHRISPAVPALALCALAPAAARAQEPALAVTTLEQALSLAHKNNSTLLLAVERVVKTRASIAQILSIKRPQISAGATYTRLLNVGSSFSGSSGGSAALTNPFPATLQGTPPGSQPVTLSPSTPVVGGSAGATRARATDTTGTGTTGTGTDITSFLSGTDLNQASARLSLTQAIDITGVIKAVDQIADYEVQIEILDIARTRNEVDFTVQSGYYGVLRAEALVTVAEAAVEESREQLRVTEAQKAAGVASEFDVLRARTQLANNEQSAISARNQVAIAKNAFANSLGIDPATPVTLTPTAAVPALPTLTENQLLAAALVRRPEARQIDLSLRKAGRSERLAHRGAEPTLSASVSAGYNPKPTGFTTEKTTGSFSLSLAYPLGDGGATRAAIDAAKSDTRSVNLQQDQYLRGIRAEVQQALVAVRDADERLRSAERTVEQARESYRLAGVRFKAGVDTQLSVNDAQAALTQSETNRVNARYDYLTALARLDRAVGGTEEIR